MILTYKIRHGRDLTEELHKAKQVAEYAIRTKSRSSADVKHIGLKSVIANQILKKYSTNKRAKKVRHVLLTIPNQAIKVNKENKTINISCLKLELNYQFKDNFEKINQIELDREYAFVSVTIPEQELVKVTGYLGVDLNTTGHNVVVGDPVTGKVLRMGKSCEHVHTKYKNMRKDLQKKGKFGRLKKIKGRESRIIRDKNHKMSRKIVDMAKELNRGIKLEALDGIRQTAKSSRYSRYGLNSWSFYQLQQMIEYKAKLLGIPVERIDPQYTSQECSRCGLLGNRNGKIFQCPHCNHVENADVNASFNIALRPPLAEGASQSTVDRDAVEGTTDSPKEAMA
jgi:putative transposase